MQIFENTLTSIAASLPVEVFVVIGSFIEEIIAPIPSPLVTTLTGSLAKAQHYPLLSLIILALLGACGKVVGSLVIYRVVDISEDIVLSRFGKLIGLSHTTVEKIGSKLHKGGRDFWVLTALRALPIIPSSPLSAVCGLIKLPLRTFIFSGLVGITIRNLLFLYIGYSGVSAYNGLLQGVSTLESTITVLGLLGALLIVGWLYIARKKFTLGS